jgi:hypothetical protein
MPSIAPNTPAMTLRLTPAETARSARRAVAMLRAEMRRMRRVSRLL